MSKLPYTTRSKPIPFAMWHVTKTTSASASEATMVRSSAEQMLCKLCRDAKGTSASSHDSSSARLITRALTIAILDSRVASSHSEACSPKSGTAPELQARVSTPKA